MEQKRLGFKLTLLCNLIFNPFFDHVADYGYYVHIEFKKKCLPYQRNIWEENSAAINVIRLSYIACPLVSFGCKFYAWSARWSHLLFCFNFQAPCLTTWIAFHEDDDVLIYDMTIFVAALKILCGKKIRDRSFSLALAIWRSKLPWPGWTLLCKCSNWPDWPSAISIT